MKLIDLSDLDDIDPKTEILNTEYNFNKKPIPFHKIEHYIPKFSFKYLALNGTEYCFNNPYIKKDDYLDLLFVKKELSKNPLSDAYGTKHFHWIIEQKQLSILKNLFSEYIKMYKIEDYSIPEFYQFAGSNNPDKCQRVIGFIGELGVFNIVWFDFNHNLYPAKKVN